MAENPPNDSELSAWKFQLAFFGSTRNLDLVFHFENDDSLTISMERRAAGGGGKNRGNWNETLIAQQQTKNIPTGIHWQHTPPYGIQMQQLEWG